MEAFANPKLLVPYMVEDLCAHVDVDQAYFVNVATGGYGISVPSNSESSLFFLGALLNSRLLSWVLRRYSRSWRGGWYAARKRNLARLPIVRLSPSEELELVREYEACVELRGHLDSLRADSDRVLVERLLDTQVNAFDSAVFDCFGVTGEERGIVCAK